MMALALATPAAAETSDVEQANAAYHEGLRAFDLGQYDRALAGFQRAYELSHAAGFLYDIALAHRMLGDCASALEFYRHYLDAEPTSPRRQKVEARIDEMRACKAAGSVPPKITDTPVAPPPPPPPPPPPHRRRTGLAIGIGAGGLALVGGSVVFGVMSQRAYDRVQAMCDQVSFECPPSAADDIHATSKWKTTSAVLLGLGAAAAAAAIVVYW